MLEGPRHGNMFQAIFIVFISFATFTDFSLQKLHANNYRSIRKVDREAYVELPMEGFKLTTI